MNPYCQHCNQELYDRNNEYCKRISDLQLKDPYNEEVLMFLGDCYFYNIETGAVTDDTIPECFLCYYCMYNEEILKNYSFRYATYEEVERYNALIKLL